MKNSLIIDERKYKMDWMKKNISKKFETLKDSYNNDMIFLNVLDDEFYYILYTFLKDCEKNYKDYYNKELKKIKN